MICPSYEKFAGHTCFHPYPQKVCKQLESAVGEGFPTTLATGIPTALRQVNHKNITCSCSCACWSLIQGNHYAHVFFVVVGQLLHCVITHHIQVPASSKQTWFQSCLYLVKERPNEDNNNNKNRGGGGGGDCNDSAKPLKVPYSFS